MRLLFNHRVCCCLVHVSSSGYLQETGVLTPTRSVIQSISNFESDKNVSPLDLGTSISFVSKTPDYSKMMLMQGEGQSVNPVVVEISKVVTGWLPGTITQMTVSPQNSMS